MSHVLQLTAAMQDSPWTRPEFRELDLGAEIGMYIANPDADELADELANSPREPDPAATIDPVQAALACT